MTHESLTIGGKSIMMSSLATRRFFPILLLVTFTTLCAAPVLAQPEPTTPEEVKEEAPAAASWADCALMGKRHGQNIGTGGSTAGGLIGGVLLGLIGTGVAVLAQSKSEPPAQYLFEMEEKGGECQYAYIEAFNQESIGKKRKAALTGGLIGTAVLLAIVVANSGS